jgi:class 3 adenylate cyclase
MSIHSRTLTIMLNDIAGFTEKTSRMSRDDMMAMLRNQDELIRPVIHYYGGRIVKTIGDAFMSVFDSPTDAVLCAIRTQYVLRSFNKDRPEKDQIHIRIALNAGEVQLAQDGDVFGEAVNAVARVEAVTPVDEIYFTERVYLSMNRNEVPDTLNVKRFIFKGIEEEITVYKVQQNADNEVYQRIIGTRIPEAGKDLYKAFKKLPGKANPSKWPAIPHWIYFITGGIGLLLIAILILINKPKEQPRLTTSTPSVQIEDQATATSTDATPAPEPSPAVLTAAQTPIQSSPQQVLPNTTAPATTQLTVSKKTTNPPRPQPSTDAAQAQASGVRTPPKTENPATIAPAAPILLDTASRESIAQKTPEIEEDAISQPVHAPEISEAIPLATHADHPLVRRLRSGDRPQQRAATREIINARAFDREPFLLDVISEELLEGYLIENPDRYELDALGWFCHALGIAGRPEHRHVLEQVANEAPNPRLKKYALSNLRKIRD